MEAASIVEVAPRLCLGGFAVGAIGLALVSRRDTRDRLRQRWLKFAVYFAVVYGMVFAYGSGRAVAIAVVGAVALGGFIELRRAACRLTHGPSVLLIYPLCGGAWLVLTWIASPGASILVYLTVAAFDGFSQVSGQLWGKRPLASRVSPGKTVEGVFGGLLAAAVIGMLLRRGVEPLETMALCSVLSMAGLAGDLGASWVKRRIGWKDFSRALPGHGGVLDRFDSMLGAAPIALAMVWFYRG